MPNRSHLPTGQTVQTIAWRGIGTIILLIYIIGKEMPVVRKVESVFRRGLVIIITPTSAVVTVAAVGFGLGRSIIQQVMLETVVLRPAERWRDKVVILAVVSL